MPPAPTSESSGHDVIVVGGRAAGAATAMLLARRGVRVLVLERGAMGTDTLSTHALMRGGVLQLDRWGLLDRIVAAGTPPIRHSSFVYPHDRVDITLKPWGGVDALYAPRRSLLDSVLAMAAMDAGADVRDRTTVTGLLRRSGRVRGVTVRSAEGVEQDVSADLVIGADGIGSTVAQLVGAGIRRAGSHATAVTYGYWSELETTGYEWVFRSNACSGVIPTNGGRSCVFASATPQRIGRGGLGVLRDVVAEGAPELARRLASAVAPPGTRTWAGHRGFMRRAHGPGWALVGDAGYYKDPISAHGITDALRDAELLARAVAAGLAGTAVELDEALARFEATRDGLSTVLFDTVDRIASQQWSDEEIARLLLQLNSSMSDEVEALAALDLEAVA